MIATPTEREMARRAAFRWFQMRAHAGLLVARSAIEEVDPHLLSWATHVLRCCQFIHLQESRP